MTSDRRRLLMAIQAGSVEPVFYERLRFDGTAWVMTDIPIPTDGSVLASLGGETRRQQNLWFTARNTGEGSIRVYWGGQTNGTRLQPMPYYRTTSYLFNNWVPSNSNAKNEVFQTCKGVGINDNSFHSYTKGNLPAPNPVQIGGLANSSIVPFNGYMEYFKIYDDTTQDVNTASGFATFTPVATLYPCLYRNQAGFWCVERRKFYGNSEGAGALTVEGAIITIG